ncbi:MAG: Fic family protein [Myxococcota bacterium]
MLELRSEPDPLSTSRTGFLCALAAAPTSMPRALCALGAYHQGLAEPFAEPRTHEERAGYHLFPVPDAVPGLLRQFMGTLVELLENSDDAGDDALVAAFAALATLLIHPFTDGNGRTAVDFAAFLLMKRGGLREPPFDHDGDTKGHLGLIATLLVPKMTWFDRTNEWRTTRMVEEFLNNASIEGLRGSDEIRAAAMALFGVRLDDGLCEERE